MSYENRFLGRFRYGFWDVMTSFNTEGCGSLAAILILVFSGCGIVAGLIIGLTP